MTLPSIALVVTAALLLGPKDPPSDKKTDAPPTVKKDPSATIDPALVPPPAAIKGKGKGKGGKGKGDSSQLGMRTPPAGLHYLFVTPRDLVDASHGTWQLGPNHDAVEVNDSDDFGSAASIHVQLPFGVRVRWLDCAMDARAGGESYTFSIGAVLKRVRYDLHADDDQRAPAVASFFVQNGRVVDARATFDNGVEVEPSAQGVTNANAWFELEVTLFDFRAAHGFRGCRIGYDPA
jgi:hypothetical protein